MDRITTPALSAKGIRICFQGVSGRRPGAKEFEVYHYEVPETLTVKNDSEILEKENATSFNGILACSREAETPGKKDLYVFTDISEACVPVGYVASVHVTVTRNGTVRETTEDRFLWTAWEGVSLTLDGTGDKFTPASINEDDHGTHMIGILLLNLLPTDTVNVEFDVVEIPAEK